MPDACRTTQLPQPLELLLDDGEVLDLRDVPIADHHVGLTGEDRRDERGDVVG